MANTEITRSLYLNLNAPLDAKTAPVDEITDLKDVLSAYRYEGMKVTVRNNGNSLTFCLDGGLTDDYWTLDCVPIFSTNTDLEDAITTMINNLCRKNRSGNIISQTSAFKPGNEVIVRTDTTNSGKATTYRVETIGEQGRPVFQKLEYLTTNQIEGMLGEWQYDLHIVSGTTIEEEGKKYLELYTNDNDGDGPDETVRIDVSNLGGGKNYDNEIAELTSGDTALQAQIDEIQDRLDDLRVSSATTIERTSASTVVYTYTNPSGVTEEVSSEEEAKDKVDNEGGSYTVIERVTEETVVTNQIITDISVTGSDTEEE